MKNFLKKFALAFALVPSFAFALCNPFVPNTVLSAAALNNAIASPCITSGTINGATITGSPISATTIDNSTIGTTIPSTGAFTSLSASSTFAAASNVTVAGTLAVTGATSTGTPTASTHAVQLKQVALYPTVASATAPDIFGAAGATINYDNTTPVTATSFAACTSAQVGSIKTIIPTANSNFTASANFIIDGATSGTFVMPLGAIIQVIPLTTTQFKVTTIYATGSWTPNQGAGLTLVGAFTSNGIWTKIGNKVYYAATLSGATSVAASAGGVMTSNLPFSGRTSFAFLGSATNGTANAFYGTFHTGGGNSVTSITAISATSQIYLSGEFEL